MAEKAFTISGTYTLLDLLKDVNGNKGYSEDKAALGTIIDDYKLKLIKGTKISDDFAYDKNPLEVPANLEAFLALNYSALATGKKPVSSNSAAFLTLLRAFVVRAGYVCSKLENRAVHVDEYEYIDVLPAIHPVIDFTSTMVQFVGDYWQTICSVVLHVFQVRGHHWKPEYSRLYDRTWNAATIEVPIGLTLPSWQEIATVGLHPFGIRALYLIREHAVELNQIPKGIILRRDAAYAGSAPIRTAAAALKEMVSARWWVVFEKKFKVDIEAIVKKALELKEVGARAHINAKLFDMKFDPFKADEAEVTKLAPYILAWMDTLDADEVIKQQKTLNKRAQGSSSIRSSFAAVLMSELKSDKSALTVAAYLATI